MTVTPLVSEQRMRTTNRKHFIISWVLLWISGAALRITILAVPPLLPVIRTDLRLSATAVGVLMSLPVALFALAALPGSAMIRRFGIVKALIVGLLLVTVGAALRGASVNAAVLFITTVIMGSGVAVLQPTMPAVVRQWMPTRIGFGTATYTNGLLIGETLPTFLTLPLLMPLLHGNWRLALALWSLPVAVTVIVVAVLAPREDAISSPRSVAPVTVDPVALDPPAAAEAARAAEGRWSPDWKLIWKLGIFFGTVNSLYFGVSAFLPLFLNARGRSDLISSSLTAMNLAQVPASFLLLAYAGRLERKAWPYVVTGVLSLVSLIGIVCTMGAWTIFWAAVLGFCGAAFLILGLTLPALLAPPAEVAHTSAVMFTISYSSAVVIAIVSGAVWDASGIPAMAFLPLGLSAVTQAVGALMLRSGRQLL